MKRLFTLFTALSVVATVSAQTQIATANGITASKAAAAATPGATTTPTTPPDEALLTMKETEFDFGKIPQGKPVTHVFTVENKGKTDLKISNVQASCGCTTPSWEKDKAVAAGAKTDITVGYNAAAEGPFTKLITISYNDGGTKQITIKGEVWKTPATSAPENKAVNDLKN
jgi:hypothetical protein